MKPKLFLFLCSPLALAAAQAGPPPAPPAVPSRAAPGPFTVVERGPHHRRWQSVVAVTEPSGRIFYRTNSYVELETGMHARDAAGNWIEAGDQIELLPGGGAVSRNARHQLYCPGDLYADALRCTTPDGLALVSRPVGLSFFDGQTNLFIAELRPGPRAQLLPPGNQVLYTNVCEGARLDLLVRNKKAGYESDLVLREQLPDPRDYGLTNLSRVRLQWWTEFFRPPAPAKLARALPDGAVDERLRFGEMTMARGTAYWVDPRRPHPAPVPVTKRWVELEGRTFLVEEVSWPGIVAQLQNLPVRTAWVNPGTKSTRTAMAAAAAPASKPGVDILDERKAAGDSRTPHPSEFAGGTGGRAGVFERGRPLPLSEWRARVGAPCLLAPTPFPPQRPVQRSTTPILLAAARSGIAPTTTTTATTTTAATAATTTTAATTATTTTITAATAAATTTPTAAEPGFLIDYSLLSSVPSFRFQSDTTYYVTNAVAISSPSIEGGTVVKFATNGLAVLEFSDQIDCRTAPYRPAIFTVQDDNSVGEILPGSTGVPVKAVQCIHLDLTGEATGARFDNVRFSHFIHAFSLYSEGLPATLRNSQFVDCTAPLHLDGNTGGALTLALQNVLATGCERFIEGFTEAEQTTEVELTIAAEHLTVDHCGALTWQTFGFTDLRLTNCLLAGVTNWGNFDFITTNTVVKLADDTGLFQTVGAGAHYLATNSPYRNAGTTNINSELLAALAAKTTSPPAVFYNQILTNNLVLGPQTPRDLDVPDLGYHYDPLDYAIGHVWLQNAAMTVLPGAAIGTFANSPGYYGLTLASGADVFCQGAPNNLVRIARCNLVQEQATTNWNIIGDSLSGPWDGGEGVPRAFFRFTDFAVAAQETTHFRSYFWEPLDIAFTDCAFHGGQIAPQTSLAITNCLLERALVNLEGYFSTVDADFRNNLFFSGVLELHHDGGGAWTFKDNLFDHAGLAQNGAALEHGCNGYVTGSDRLTPTVTNDVVAGLSYEAGWLGNYYQPANSPFLDKGSISNAALAGLFHYTTATNQLKEANSRLDIGLHYVAVDGNGRPLDTDADGLPDYLEDLNGNGLLSLGETPFGITIDNPLDGSVLTR